MILRINSCLFLCSFSIALFFNISVKAQNLEDIKISGRYNKVSLISFLNEIEKTNSIRFYYNPEWFEKDTINLFFNNTPLNEAISGVIKGKSLIKIQDSAFIFLPDEEIALLNGQKIFAEESDLGTKIIGNPSEAGKYSRVNIKGTINDGKNGEPIVGATIQIENTNLASVSNVKGQYTLLTAPGIYNLIISSVGYEKTNQKVKIVSNGELNIELFEKAFKINEIIVYAQKADRNVRSTQMSILEFDSKAIKQLPSLTGEKDIIKSLTMMPGVKSVGEFGSGINVRGGSADQNLFLLEGTPLFFTSHVFGLISVINPDAVNNVTLYKGNIPANLGERVSSVMDIGLKDNTTKTFNGSGGIGIFTSRLMLDVPLYKENLSLKIGGRTSYSNWILNQLPDYYLKTSKVDFYDLNSILTWNKDKNRIVAFAYNSNDNFKYANQLAFNYKNISGSVNWSHYFSDNATTTLLYSYSECKRTNDSLGSNSDGSRIYSTISYQSLKFNFSKKIGNSHLIDAGFNSILYNNDPGEKTDLGKNSTAIPFNLQKENALENAIYVNDRYNISERFSINLGLRYSYYLDLGPRLVYNYIPNKSIVTPNITDTLIYKNNSIIKTSGNLEPRLALKMQIDETSSLKISYNKSCQYLLLISSTAVPSPDDIWKLADKYTKPTNCNQYTLGVYKNFDENKIEASVEIYYKTLTNVVDYKNGAQLIMNPHIETELVNADGKNYGIEFLLKKNVGTIDGWISYTWSRSLIKSNGKNSDEIINKNAYYPSAYDKPNDLTILGTWHINRRLRVSGNFTYSTGRPLSLPELKYQFYGQQVVQFSDRGKYRLPDYHRLDLSISLDESLRIKKKWKGSWTFSILNVYGRQNAYSVFYSKQTPSASNNFQIFGLSELYIIGIPMPTLTYNFIF